jgi:hypothetical protein
VPLALSRKRAGEGHSKALVDNAQTSYRTTAITASACEVIFELGSIEGSRWPQALVEQDSLQQVATA